MIPDFQHYRARIVEQVHALLSRAKSEYAGINTWAEDLLNRLARFSTQGKMVRGGLVLFSCGLFGEIPDNAVRAAAALELVHSSLLIHDDIMDRDLLRRGEKTIFSQYADLARRAGEQRTGSPAGGVDPAGRSPESDISVAGADAYHHGESLGICAGDIGYFLAFGELALLEIPQPLLRQLVQRWSRELAAVGLAQMQDIELGMRPGPAREEEVLSLYRYKTARYTFSLPLWTGALLAGQERPVRERLEEAGETLGVIFQIKDDELGLFGSTRRTGKPVGGDLQEGKRTLYRIYLEGLAAGGDAAGGDAGADPSRRHGNVPRGSAGSLPPAQRERLSRILSEGRVGAEELEFVRGVVRENGVQDRVSALLDRLVRRAREQISTLPVPDHAREQFLGMLAYNLERSR